MNSRCTSSWWVLLLQLFDWPKKWSLGWMTWHVTRDFNPQQMRLFRQRTGKNQQVIESSSTSFHISAHARARHVPTSTSIIMSDAKKARTSVDGYAPAAVVTEVGFSSLNSCSVLALLPVRLFFVLLTTQEKPCAPRFLCGISDFPLHSGHMDQMQCIQTQITLLHMWSSRPMHLMDMKATA